MGDIVVAIALLAVSLFTFILSIRSFMEKGFLLNNAYIYASKKEREEMNKKPYYRQTAIIFLFITIIFLTLSLAILLNIGRLAYIAEAIIPIMLIYAVVSGIAIEKAKKHK